MFKLVQLEPYYTGIPPGQMLELVHYEARTVGKRAVLILLGNYLMQESIPGN